MRKVIVNMLLTLDGVMQAPGRPDEDPRGEDRGAILDEIAAGARAAGREPGRDLLCIADRREAIAAAFERARPTSRSEPVNDLPH